MHIVYPCPLLSEQLRAWQAAHRAEAPEGKRGHRAASQLKRGPFGGPKDLIDTRILQNMVSEISLGMGLRTRM